VRSPACSTNAIRHADRRAIGGQSVRLSANSPRPERRSTDGQTIFTVSFAGWKPASDLLVCGAPLRKRTVDLLLTMNHRTVPLPLVERLTSQNTSTDQHPQAPYRPPRARFAPQSALHFDLAAIG
jgi:hypothetical protein